MTIETSQGIFRKGSLGSLFFAFCMLFYSSAYSQSGTVSKVTYNENWLKQFAIIGEHYFENRSSLTFSLAADYNDFSGFNKLKLGQAWFLSFSQIIRYDYRLGQGWYLGPSFSFVGRGTDIPSSDYGLFLGHRGKIKRDEIYIEASITRMSAEIESIRYQGLIGFVFPRSISSVWAVRPSIFFHPYLDRELNPDVPVSYRTLSGLDWRLSASILYNQLFSLTPYINLNASYYTVTVAPIRSELDLHQWSAGLTFHYYWDKNNIQDKLLKFY